MIDFAQVWRTLDETPLQHWSPVLQEQLATTLRNNIHGDLRTWVRILEKLPRIDGATVDLQAPDLCITRKGGCDPNTLTRVESLLRRLAPWRKGPFNVHSIHVDTEWRSDWKWQRLQGDIKPLQNRMVLDVGCGSGYHCWRIAGAGARFVLGIDPGLLSVVQFYAIKHFIGERAVFVLPFALESLPGGPRVFDTVFSMGVLYHRRSPFDHLLKIRSLLAPGGELVLETLVVEGGEGQVLVPEDRYAKMRNVWFLPSCDTLLSWLRRCGFRNPRCIDVTVTTTQEQRSTEWMQYDSLREFLDPENSTRTVEGYPAPQRAIFLASC